MIEKLYEDKEIYLILFKLKIKKSIDEILNDFENAYAIVAINRKYIKGKMHLIASAYHYMDTIERGKVWIKDNNYRFAGFILMESQINKIIETLSNNPDVIVAITSKPIQHPDYEDIEIEDGDRNILAELAIFRLNIERERLL